uniref:Uncharacterized protein n=2 Tax=Dendroctonus ponderosae TaxID=77166 RepID=A0AAR5PE57_DENPD
MGLQRNLVLVVSCAFLLSVCAAEFVPVYIWGTRSAGEPVPALHKISQSSFKDEVANKLRANSRIIVFAEHSLSPEDFGQRDRSGDLAFPNLSKLRKTSKVTYLSYVQNPVKAIQLASDDVAEISIERLRENFEIPDSKIVIIDLNDADENERRFDMLKRHDDFIASLYSSVLEKNENVLALYTAHHASWIGSGEVHSRKVRSLERAASITTNQYMDN